MTRCYFKAVLFLLLTLSSAQAFCCTSVIISGKVRADGRPVMLKHRDTDELNNRMQWFKGPEYSFIGLVNSSSDGGEVWAGTNSSGFCIMNTATYDLKDDNVPDSQMDNEGKLMFKALGICSTLKDFEDYLGSLPKPWGVECNFGIIDASGEAAYYEVNNHSWKRYDVEDQPGGYMLVTNFTRSGRLKDRKGVDRFEKASEIFASMDISTADHKTIFNEISRSGSPVLRDITSASVVFEGVAAGDDPLHTVMWTILGCPSSSVYIPLMVFDRDHIPSFMKEDRRDDKSQICSESLVIKGIYGLYPGCCEECRKVEEYVDLKFSPEISQVRYDRLVKKIYRRYKMMYRRKLPKVVH